MYVWVRRARGYIASALLLYTFTVTYILIRAAWTNGIDPFMDGSPRGAGKDAEFLTVLVREERRHLQNVQDVVHNYRSPEEEEAEASWDKPGGDLQMFTPPNDTSEVYLANTPDVNHRKASAPKQQIPVEVEEWDGGIVEQRRQAKAHFAILTSQQKAFKAAAESALNNQLPGLPPQIPTGSPAKLDPKPPKKPDTTEYTTNYCSRIDHKEHICEPERVSFNHPDHAPLAKSTMMFTQLGDIHVYSAFLDPRPREPVVRLMSLGLPNKTNQSVFWCVFDSRKFVNLGSLGKGRGSRYYKFDHEPQTTPLGYYAASDGHNKPKQFYIMSCKVPSGFVHVLNRSDVLEIRVVVGTLDNPLLDTVQEELVLPVINNFASKKAKWRTSSGSNANSNSVPNTFSISSNTNSDDGFISDDEEITGRTIRHNDYAAPLHVVPEKSLSNGSATSLTSGANSSSQANRPATAHKFERVLPPRDRLVSCVVLPNGPLAVVQVVEFIELTLLLGTQHITLYSHPGLDEGIQNVLDMYGSQGLVTTLPWNLPSGPDDVWVRGRDAALNDCLYRAMFLFDFALFHDMDEFYVPRATPDLPSFLNFLRHKGGLRPVKHTDLVFSSAYFPPPSKAQYKEVTVASGFTKDVNKFTTLKSVRRSYINSKHPLRIVNTTAAIRVGAGERQRTSFVIMNRLASVNHYSHCPPDVLASQSAGGAKPECDHKPDWAMWRYKTVLIQKVKDNVRALHKLLRAKKHR